VTLQPVSPRLPTLLDRKAKSEYLATRLCRYLSQRLCRPASGEEVVNDEQSKAGREDPARNLDVALDSAGRIYVTDTQKLDICVFEPVEEPVEKGRASEKGAER